MKLHEIIPNALYQSARPDKTFEDMAAKYRLRWVVAMIDAEYNMPSGVAKISFPIADSTLTPERWASMRLLALSVEPQITLGAPILVHCNAGRNRSGLMCCLIVSLHYRMSGMEAREYVRERRPNSVDNPNFIKLLEGLKW